VVLIRTPDGLGSGVVLDAAGNIVTNAHVAGAATRFQVQLTGDPTLRSARLIGSYPADDLAVIQPDETSGLKPDLRGLTRHPVQLENRIRLVRQRHFVT
jgi:putative serine protease PepD